MAFKKHPKSIKTERIFPGKLQTAQRRPKLVQPQGFAIAKGLKWTTYPAPLFVNEETQCRKLK